MGNGNGMHRDSAARVLQVLLQRRSRTWSELEAAGLNRQAVRDAAGVLVEQGECRIRFGPLLVELETGPGVEDVPLP